MELLQGRPGSGTSDTNNWELIENMDVIIMLNLISGRNGAINVDHRKNLNQTIVTTDDHNSDHRPRRKTTAKSSLSKTTAKSTTNEREEEESSWDCIVLSVFVSSSIGEILKAAGIVISGYLHFGSASEFDLMIGKSYQCFVVRNKEKKFKSVFSPIRSQASDVGFGSSNYDGREKFDSENTFSNGSTSESSSQIEKHPSRVPYPLSIAMVLSGCALVFSLIVFVKGGPSSILAAIAKTGFTAAFTLILISEIGDKGNLTGLGMQAYLLILESWERKESHGTFFIAALLAMQYKKGLVLLGSMGALALMSILSVMIGRIFQSVPAQFQTKRDIVDPPLEVHIVPH
ncbi:Protein PAM71-homolog chloroplastic [Bienertia sinuspersici]